ncbi:MAG: 5-formyltetrahydrofolate cyclo-ligase [Barnesiella sp.]|nr:5-formyltetrahydrofolate cyclo-ligase [Barnesiella sp.]MBD5331271.1 5-formyltetrahydrofolate cyclo-ligase [Bacteroides sp.]MBD5374460.1 5-formyltetrahydrofolate cyclo-ligase [Bacteroides sp.]MDE7460556.1 5-formyltetrahydrofolate cyclo-ligase [Paramuribaculum sp.]
MKKEDIRRSVRASKCLLSEADRETAAERVFSRLEELAAFMMSDHILMYHSLPDELSTRSFLGKWAGRKRFYLPRVNGVNLDILPYDRSRLHLGSFHIEEPDGDNTVSVDDIEMIVVPAVAYDRKGNRVGRGKGYYDRLLADSKAVKVGVAYDFQFVDEIDAEPHDIPVDIVITQSRTIILRRSH